MPRSLWIALSLALMSASANAAVSSSQIDQIEILIEDGNWVELRAYLESNPRLLVGNSALAEELRRFMENTENLFTALIFDQSLFPDITASQATTSPVSVRTNASAATTRAAPSIY